MNQDYKQLEENIKDIQELRESIANELKEQLKLQKVDFSNKNYVSELIDKLNKIQNLNSLEESNYECMKEVEGNN